MRKLPNIPKALLAIALSGALAAGSAVTALAEDSLGPDHGSVGSAIGSCFVETISNVSSRCSFESAVGGCISECVGTVDENMVWVTCTASTYGIGDGLLGSGCADGSVVTETSMGVAHKTLPLGTKIEVSYKDTTVEAVVCDRGPYIEGRELDLQPAVANALGVSGLAEVSYRVIE